MPESLLGGALGGEEQKQEVEGPEALAGVDAFAAAVAAIASRQDPGVARKTEEFLSAQSQLLKVQKAHLEDEHALRVAHLRNQLREEKVRRFGLYLRVGFQLFLVLIATVIGIGIAIMIRDAVASRRVVIEPVRVPAALAARGLDGTIVAGAILDGLSRLQDATRSNDAALGQSGAWAGNIKLDVPETGISIGEISRLLRERFGHDVHIDGDLIESPQGVLVLTIRGNGVPPRAFAAAATNLEKLIDQAAEYVYSKSQPSRWAAFLSLNGRNAEAIEFCRTAAAGADPQTRAALLNDWANALENTGGSLREALALYREAVKLKPDLWRSYANLMNTLMLVGEEEEAWRVGEDMRMAAGGRPGRATELAYQNWDLLTWNMPALLETNLTDAAANAGAGTQVNSAGLSIADAQMRLHDPDAAELALKTTREDPHDPTIAAITHFVTGRLAAELGDAPRAVSELEAFGAAYVDPLVSSNYPGYQCWIAPAEEAAGQHDKADAVLKSGGSFVDCYRFHGEILDGRGDWKGAQEWYAKAVALAPDLPAGYYSWGVALSRHGDLVGAEAKIKDANQRGPHWADPLKAWGDVLVKQVKIKEALVKYDEALKYAPNWQQLKDARAAVARQKS